MKHLGQAAILFKESRKGYPLFPIYVRAHMAEAEDELVLDHQDRAMLVRDVRLAYETDPSEYMPDFNSLLTGLIEYADELARQQLRDMGYDEHTIADIQAS